jgi:hypothetical protein
MRLGLTASPYISLQTLPRTYVLGYFRVPLRGSVLAHARVRSVFLRRQADKAGPSTSLGMTAL